MGNATSISKVLGLTCCNDCVKYVLNDCEIHSECSECCKFDVETHKVDIPPSDDDIGVDITREGVSIHA